MNRALCKLAEPQRCHGKYAYLKIINKKRIFKIYIVYYICRHNIFRDIVTEISNVKV